MKLQKSQKRDDSDGNDNDSATKTTRTMTEKKQARHNAIVILSFGEVTDMEVPDIVNK